MKKTALVTFLITVFTFGMGLYLFPRMPKTMATHWGIDGMVNGYSPRAVGTFIIPAVMLLMWIIFLVAPVVDPKRKNIELFREAYDRFILILFMFFEYIYLVQLAWNLGYRFDFLRAVLPTFAVIWFVMGDLISEAKPNWTIGIRLPWTLSDTTVWNKTNKLAGKLFKYAAGLALLTLFFPAYSIYLVLAPVIATVIVTVVYAYIQYNRKTK